MKVLFELECLINIFQDFRYEIMSHLLVQRLHRQIQNMEYQQTLEENPGYRGH